MLRRKRKSLACDEDGDASKSTADPFVSQFKRPSSTGSPLKRQCKNGDTLDKDSMFCQLVSKAGVKLKNGVPHQLDVDQAIFQRDLKNLLRTHPRYPAVIEEFVDSMKTYFSNPEKLESFLMPADISPQCKSSRGGEQDSLLRLLLGVDILQPSFIPCLLEKVAEASIMQGSGSTSGTDIPILILSQMRWLGVLVDSKGLADKMLEILPVLPLDLQKKMIILFPEILHDSEHSEVARSLSEMMLDNKNLIMVIADSLSTLNVQPKDIVDVKQSVLDMLQTVPIDELPTLIGFLLDNIHPEQASQIISEVRLKIDLITSLIPISTSTPAKANVSIGSTGKNMGIQIMEACLSACRWQKIVCETWIKVIENTSETKDHLSLDLVMIILLYSLETRRKTIEGLIRNKIRTGHFNLPLLKNTIETHSKVLKERFSCALRLANVLLRSYESSVSKFGSAIYKNLFVTQDKYCQQEVIGQLMTHVGSRVPSEIDAALEILSNLVEDNRGHVAPFSSFLKSLLDYLDFLSLDQTRIVYSLLSELAYKAGPEGALVQDELRIVIRKQVTHFNSKYKRMGVVGALMAAKAMCVPRLPDKSRTRRSSLFFATQPSRRSDVGECSSTQSDRSFSQETIQLLDLVKKSCNHCADTTALFYDELCRLLQQGQLDDKVEYWINEMMLNTFQDTFVTDIDPTKALDNVDGVPVKVCQSQPGDVENTMAINLTALLLQEGQTTLTSSQRKSDVGSSLTTLPAQFRLLRICEHCQNSGDLEGIDLLSFCPIILPTWEEEVAMFSKQPAERKKLICSAILHCINWLREVLNAFVGQKDNDTKEVVVYHLQHIVKLQETLQWMVPATPGFTFPLAVFDFPDLQVATTKSKPKAEAKKDKPSKGKGKKTNVSPSSQTQGSPKAKDTQAATQHNDAKTGDLKSSSLDLSVYRTSFRELDLEVFNLLRNGLDISKAPNLFSQLVKKRKSLKLLPSELLFLLEDLFLKVEHVLPSSSPKRISPLMSRSSKQAGFSNLSLYSAFEVASAAVDLFPDMCTLLEDCCSHFQDILNQNDGVYDGPGMNSKMSETLTSCMALLFKIVNTVMSCCSFQEADHHDVFDKALGILGSRLASSQGTQIPQERKLKLAFKYLSKYEETLSTMESGVALVRLLQTLASNPQAESNLRHATSNIAKNLLTRAWPNCNLKGQKINDQIQTFLTSYIVSAEHPVRCLQDICSNAIAEIIKSDDKEAPSKSFPTLTRNTFITYHRVVFSQVAEFVKNIRSEEESEIISDWNTAVNIFTVVITVVKVKPFDNRMYLSSCLRYGRLFVESFNRQCMPLLDRQFSHKTETIMLLIKGLQPSTRYLQHICGHAKAKKDVSLTRYVPPLKKALETFVFKVKDMLARNNCKEAFWIGNLKNRNLQGEEILSQVNRSQSDDDDDDDDDDNNDDGAQEDKADQNNGDEGIEAPSESDAEGHQSDEY